MKKTIFILGLFVLTFASSLFAQNTEEKNKNAPEIIFKKTTHDYGFMKQNADGTCEFVFQNKGKEPLILTNVRSSCGCTIPTWPKDPVKKNKKGVIKVKYDTRRQGKFMKTITVYSNAKNSPVHLTIKGEVERVSIKKKAAPTKEKSMINK